MMRVVDATEAGRQTVPQTLITREIRKLDIDPSAWRSVGRAELAAAGLVRDNAVKIAGVKVGKIEDIEVVPEGAHLTLLVDEVSTRPVGIACRREDSGACLTIVGGEDQAAILRTSRESLDGAGIRFTTRATDPRSFLVGHAELVPAARALHATWFETASHGAVPARALRDRE